MLVIKGPSLEFEIIAEDNSEKSIDSLLELKADYANLEQENGKVKKVKVDNRGKASTVR